MRAYPNQAEDAGSNPVRWWFDSTRAHNVGGYPNLAEDAGSDPVR